MCRMDDNVAEKHKPDRQPSNHPKNEEKTFKKDAVFIPEFQDEACMEIVDWPSPICVKREYNC